MSNTKTAILNIAEHLIRTKGYHAFSYKDIAQSLEVKNAAIHYHYPSKEDLGLAMTERTRERFAQKTIGWVELSPKEKLSNFILLYQESSESNLVCFMGALGPSFQVLPKVMQDSLHQASAEIRNYIKSILEEGLATGDFSFPENLSEKADLIASSMLASLILTRVTKEDIFSNIKNALWKQVLSTNVIN